MSKRLGGIIDCKYKTSWHSIGLPNGIIVTLGQQYHVGEKPTVILYKEEYCSVCNIGSRVVQVPTKEIY